MTPHTTPHARKPEPLVDEDVAAPVAGMTARSLQKRRLQGTDHPPFVPVGPRRVKYLLSAVSAWVNARTVQTTNPSTSNSTHEIMIATTTCDAAMDASLAELDQNKAVRHAVREVLSARIRRQDAESEKAILFEAVSATLIAGIEPTAEAVTATLAAFTSGATADMARIKSDSTEVREAFLRHAALLEPLRHAIATRERAFAAEAQAGRTEAAKLRRVTDGDAMRVHLLSVGVHPDRTEGLLSLFPKELGTDERHAEAALLAEAARTTDMKAAVLRGLLVNAPLLDLDAVQSAATEYPAIGAALASVREALGMAVEVAA